MYASNADTIETEEEPEGNWVKSAFRMDDMDIELSLSNEDDEEEMKPENVSSLRGVIKLIVYKSSLEQRLPSQCLLWKPQAGN